MNVHVHFIEVEWILIFHNSVRISTLWKMSRKFMDSGQIIALNFAISILSDSGNFFPVCFIDMIAQIKMDIFLTLYKESLFKGISRPRSLRI